MKLIVEEKDSLVKTIKVELTPVEALVVNSAMRGYIRNEEVNEEDRVIANRILGVEPMIVNLESEK